MLNLSYLAVLAFDFFGRTRCSNQVDVPNPALELFRKFDKLAESSHVSDISEHKNYRRLVEIQVEAFARFGIHVPTAESMNFIASLDRPVVEIGSASGYLANQLSRRGIDVVAVDPMPMEETRKWGEGWSTLKGYHQPVPSKVYHPTVETDAMSYLRTHDWCRGKVILLMNHVLNSWLELLDWDMVKSDAIVVSFSSESYHEVFRELMRSSATWVFANSTEIPKYYAGDTSNRFQRIESWVRRTRRYPAETRHDEF